MIRSPLPHLCDIAGHLDRLEANPGSVVILAIEWPRESQNFTRTTVAWLSAAERKKVRDSLNGIRRTRKNGEVSKNQT